MHIARVGERLPRLQIQFRISRSFRPRNLENLGSKIRFWIRRKEHTLGLLIRARDWTKNGGVLVVLSDNFQSERLEDLVEFGFARVNGPRISPRIFSESDL